MKYESKHEHKWKNVPEKSRGAISVDKCIICGLNREHFPGPYPGWADINDEQKKILFKSMRKFVMGDSEDEIRNIIR